MRKPASSFEDLEGLRGRDWIRESRQRQFDRHDGNAQRRNCAVFRERFGVVDGGPAYVVAHSGKTVWKTPTMRQLIGDVQSESFDVLVCGYFDRWQRNLRKTLEIVEDVLHPHGVAWVMADRRLISGNPQDWQQMQAEALDAQNYSDDLREKVRDGYRAKLDIRHDQGGGHVPVGFTRDPKSKLVLPDPEAMPLSVRAWELSAQGWTDGAIADELGLTLWTVRKILRSTLFRGFVRPAIPTNFAAPIAPDVADRALAHRATRTRITTRPRVRRTYPLTGGGPLVCGTCKEPIKGDTKTRRNGDKVRIYRHKDGDACSGWPVREVPCEVIEGQVERLLEQAAPTPESRKRILSALAVPGTTIDRLGIARLDARLKQLATELVAADRSRDLDAILAEIEATRGEREALRSAPVPAPRVSPEAAIEYLSSLGRLWRMTDDEGRRALAVAVFRRIEVVSDAAPKSHRITSIEVTPDAEAHGILLALPADVTPALSAAAGADASASHTRRGLQAVR